jgi:hypothetical protein
MKAGKGLGCVSSSELVLCSAGIRLGAKDRGTVWATVDKSSGSWRLGRFCVAQLPSSLKRQCIEGDTICFAAVVSEGLLLSDLIRRVCLCHP